MNQSLTIQIPFELARFATWQRVLVNKYETNAMLRVLDTWLVLKSITRSGLIQRWNFQKQYLFTVCKCSESIFRSRLKSLKQLQLVEFDRHNIRVCSWEKLAKVFEIDCKNRYTIQFDYNGKQRIYEWLIATEIKDNQSRQAYAIRQKLNNNPELLQSVLGEIIKEGADSAKCNDFDYVLSWMMIIYRQDFVRASDIHNALIEVRPDTNRSVRGMALSWNCKSPSTISYWKGKLQNTGIAYISKLIVESQERVRNRECKVIWLRKKLQTALCMCDNIQILEAWNRPITAFKAIEKPAA